MILLKIIGSKADCTYESITVIHNDDTPFNCPGSMRGRIKI
jgi:hypothetical protein